MMNVDSFQWQRTEVEPCRVECKTLKAYGLTMPAVKSDLTPQDRAENRMTELAMWGVLMIVVDQLHQKLVRGE